jgi:hypothetical protein
MNVDSTKYLCYRTEEVDSHLYTIERTVHCSTHQRTGVEIKVGEHLGTVS